MCRYCTNGRQDAAAPAEPARRVNSSSTWLRTPFLSASAPKRSALAIARLDELPWQITTNPLTPRR